MYSVGTAQGLPRPSAQGWSPSFGFFATGPFGRSRPPGKLSGSRSVELSRTDSVSIVGSLVDATSTCPRAELIENNNTQVAEIVLFIFPPDRKASDTHRADGPSPD
jgi:hypothetical protein